MAVRCGASSSRISSYQARTMLSQSSRSSASQPASQCVTTNAITSWLFASSAARATATSARDPPVRASTRSARLPLLICMSSPPLWGHPYGVRRGPRQPPPALETTARRESQKCGEERTCAGHRRTASVFGVLAGGRRAEGGISARGFAGRRRSPLPDARSQDAYQWRRTSAGGEVTKARPCCKAITCQPISPVKGEPGGRTPSRNTRTVSAWGPIRATSERSGPNRRT